MKYVNKIVKSGFLQIEAQDYDLSKDFQGFERKLNRIQGDFEKYYYCRQSIYKVLKIYKDVTNYIELMQKESEWYGSIENHQYLFTYQSQLKDLFLAIVKVERKESVKAFYYLNKIFADLINPFQDMCNLFFEPYGPIEINHYIKCQHEHIDSRNKSNKENKSKRKLKIIELPGIEQK